MGNNFDKWLCIGGAEQGNWVEKHTFFEVYPHDGNPLRPHIYKPKTLLNPITNREETFYVLTTLKEDRIPLLLSRAINGDAGE